MSFFLHASGQLRLDKGMPLALRVRRVHCQACWRVFGFDLKPKEAIRQLFVFAVLLDSLQQQAEASGANSEGQLRLTANQRRADANGNRLLQTANTASASDGCYISAITHRNDI